MATRHYIDFGAGFVEVVGAIRTNSPNTPGGGFDGLTSSGVGGDYGSGGVTIDDPLGTYDIVGWRPYYADEDTATPPRLFTGFINQRVISQGDLFEHQGTARTWDCDIGDLNLILGFKLFRKKKRPAETDIARVDWMLAHWPAPDYPVFDNGGVTASTRNFDEADLDGQFPVQVLENMILGTRMFYLYWDETASTGEEVSLFFGLTSSARGTSDIKLSNDPADFSDPDVRQAFNGMAIDREPGYTYSGVYIRWRNGKTYYHDQSTADTYIDRDMLYDTDRIGLQSTADTRGEQLLDRASTEKDVLTCDVVLLNADVNRVKEGYRIPVTFTHLPGYETETLVTIQKRTIKRPENGARDRYVVSLELSNDRPGTSSEGGGDPGDFPHPPGLTPSVVQHKPGVAGFHLDAVPVDDNLMLVWATSRLAVPPTVSGWDIVADVAFPFTGGGIGSGQYGRLYSRIASGESLLSGVLQGIGEGEAGSYSEWSAGTSIDDFVFANLASETPDPVLNCGGAITSSRDGIVVGFAVVGGFFGVVVTEDPSVTVLDEDFRSSLPDAPRSWSGYKDGHAGVPTTITGTLAGEQLSSGVTVVLVSAASADPPSPGRWVYGEVLATVAGVGTTVFPYADGSPVVRVDGVIISRASYTETDPSAGTITLSWTPDADETVTVDYMGR